MRPHSFIGSMLLLMATASASAQTTRNVPAQFATIQSAINASAHGHTVLVAPGTHNGPVNFFGKNITVTSSGGASATTIVGNSAQRVVTINLNETSAVLNGFKITGGSGGILVQNASSTISNCIVTGNAVANFSGGSTGTGGGISILATGAAGYGTSINGCTVTGNIAGANGGGIYIESQNGTLLPSISNCTVSNNSTFGGVSNTSAGGSGICVYRSGGTLSITIDRCTIRGNTGAFAGGGLELVDVSTATVTNSRFLDNTLSGNQGYSIGGGIYATGTQATINNCLIAGNTSTVQGGGIYCFLQSGTILNCTIANNYSTMGGGISIGSNGISIVNTIVWGNGGSQIQPGPTPPAITYSTIEGGLYASIPTNAATDPRFVDSANGNYHLSAQSPCVNSGNSAVIGIVATDLDGLPRVVGPTIDRGSDEAPIATLPGTNEDLDLYATVDGVGDPLATTTVAPALSNLNVLLRSPGGGFTGSQPLIAAQLFPTGMPPLGLVAIPQVHLDAVGSFVVFGVPGAGPFGAPGLPQSGIAMTFLVPPGLSGTSLRLQGFGVASIALNGVFAVTNARDLVF